MANRMVSAQGSSSIYYLPQSLYLCAVLSPCCVQHIFPPQSLTSLRAVGSCHVVYSQPYQTLSSTTHRDAGCDILFSGVYV